MKYIRLFILTGAAGIVLLVTFHAADTAGDQPEVESKINGVSFVAPAHPVEVEAMRPIKKLNANWAAIIPYAFSQAGSPQLRFNLDRQWWGEGREGVTKTIKYAQQLDMKVMLKPQVWVQGSGWTGNFSLATQAEWKTWENNYRNYIIYFAKLADSLDVEIYCIGTEYRKAAVQRPEFWRGLIEATRKVYGGKLTYAANWDNYRNIAFWDELDYIGVDAYFPLSEQLTPTVSHLRQQWQPVKEKLQAFAGRQGSPVLFTEFGYRSIDFTANAHWKDKQNEREPNMQAQVNAYRALFETFWEEPWFAGGFLWKWFNKHEQRGGPSDKRYTPQNKPAEGLIQQWYGRETASGE